MPCFKPLKGYRSKDRNPSGKRSIVFNRQLGHADQPLELPCGQCMGCRLERSRQWAIRCVHEASLYEQNCFITLTYADKYLPPGGSLVVSDYQKFMKRLRLWNESQYRVLCWKSRRKFVVAPPPLRFFHCGEYGDLLGRPHYHACLFNFDFVDKTHWKVVNGENYYVSETLKKLWPYGHSVIGDVTFESAAYVARYITKKVTGPRGPEYYGDRKPEYVTMSRRPGIGKEWYEKFKADVFPGDFVVHRDKTGKAFKCRPPKFYNTQLEKECEAAYRKIKAEREVAAAQHKEENTHDRLMVREEVLYERMKLLRRGYDDDN